MTLATALSTYYWQFDAAAEHYRRALELNPSYANAHRLNAEYLRFEGRFDEALAAARQGLDRLRLLSRTQNVSPWHSAIIYLGLGEVGPSI